MIELARELALPLGPTHLDLDEQLREAGAHGIEVLVSSPNLLGEVLDLPGAEAADLLQGVNSAVAGAQAEHGGRFAGLAMLPMQDPDAARAVLDDAYARGLRGVCMLPTIDGGPIATEATLPVFERIEALRMPLVLHPELRSPGRGGGGGRRAEAGIGWMCDTSVAALALIDSGTLDACPRLVVLHPHLGGVLAWLHGRVNRISPPEGRPPLAHYLRTRFYVDSLSGTPGALRFAADVYGPERILFASDHPFVPMSAGHGYVRAEGAAAIYANRLPGMTGTSRWES